MKTYLGKIKIGPIQYGVFESDEFPEQMYGECNFDQRAISIKPTPDRVWFFVTLVHEMVHAAIPPGNVALCEEAMCELVGNAMTQNMDFLAKIWKLKEPKHGRRNKKQATLQTGKKKLR
jgi:hypothetical protein